MSLSAISEKETLAKEAAYLDQQDSLSRFRERFYLNPGQIYLDGNSLGLLSRDAEAETLRVLAEWRELAIGGWTEARPPWFFLAETLGIQVADLVGAEPNSVIVTGSATVNLHQLLATLYSPDAKRLGLLADKLAFPSDIYAMESHLRLRGVDPKVHLHRVPSRDGRTLATEDILASFTDDIQVAVLPSVIYTSGQLLDMPRLTAAAHSRGIVLLWDLSHSVGVVPHALDRIGADGAFWCHYKYLNAGPGAVGGLYLNRRHWQRLPGLAGWFGSEKTRQFEMDHSFAPAMGAGAMQIGTPPILAMAPLIGSMRVHQEAGIEAIREKSLRIVGFLRRCAEALLAPHGIAFALPAGTAHGGHLALTHPEAKRLSVALRRRGVVPDHRPPDILRLAPIPLYTSFQECLTAVTILRDLLEEGSDREAGSGQGSDELIP